MRINMGRAAIHTGEHLAEQLSDPDISAAELGRRLKVPTDRITGILNGQPAITGGSTLRLAEAKAGAAIRRLPRLRESEKSEPLRNQAGTA